MLVGYDSCNRLYVVFVVVSSRVFIRTARDIASQVDQASSLVLRTLLESSAVWRSILTKLLRGCRLASLQVNESMKRWEFFLVILQRQKDMHCFQCTPSSCRCPGLAYI